MASLFVCLSLSFSSNSSRNHIFDELGGVIETSCYLRNYIKTIFVIDARKQCARKLSDVGPVPMQVVLEAGEEEEEVESWRETLV